MFLYVHDIQNSSLPSAVGLCSSDLPGLLSMLNEATQRLITAKEMGDTGWHGMYLPIVFNIDPFNPYVVTPREIARLDNIDICGHPIKVNNQFAEYLLFGDGLQKPPCNVGRRCRPTAAYDRGNVATRVAIPAGNIVRVYPSNAADKNKRVFINAIDTNGNQITTLDNAVQVNGFFISIDTPFADSAYTLQADGILNIIKDTTLGPVSIYGVDPTTGVQTLLVTLAPSENNPSFRKYFLTNLPSQCFTCGSGTGSVQMNAMAVREYVPLTCDTDRLLIGNLPAMKMECMAIRLETMDNSTSKAESLDHHKRAIRYLQGELVKYEGREQPALGFQPFGRARLAGVRFNMI